MVIRKLMGSLCLVVSGLFAGAQDTTTKTLNTSEVLTLQQAVDIAIKNNLEVQQSNVTMQRTKVSLNQAKANMLPSLSADVSHGISQGRNINPFTNTYIDQSLNNANYNLNAGIVLFNGFFIQNNIRLYKYAYEASRLEYQQMKDNLTLNVILTYLQILTNEDQLTQSLNQVDVTKQQVSRLELMNRDGAIPPSDLFDLKGQLASDELSYVNSKNTLENSKLTLAQYLNVPYSRDLKIEKLTAEQLPVQYDGDINAIYEKASTELAMVQAAILRTRSADKAVKTARADMFPVLSLNGGYSTNYSSLATTQRFLNSTLDSVGFVRGTSEPVLFKNDQFAADKISYGDQFK
ncbi:MAG: TolC family protein, partial [Chitinophagaceae bacterium]